MKNKKKKRLETSKKLALLSGICFVVALVYSIGVFTYSVLNDISCDFTMLITLITVTGAAFGTTTAFYYNKSKAENLYKVKSSYLKVKYLILKDVDVLDESEIQSELQTELDKIESFFDEEELCLNKEIGYNEQG